MWEYVAKIGMDFLAGSIAAGKQEIAGINQNTLQQQQNQVAWEDNAAANKTIADTNLQNQIRTGYRTGILNVQRGQAAKAAAQSGVNLGKQRLQALGAVNANAAAAGSIGSSVDAVALDIEMQAEQADAGLVEDQRITQSNFDSGMHDIIQAGEDALRSPQHANVRTPAEVEHVGAGDILMNSLIGTAGQYATQVMSLGLGNKKTER
jgi:hypothetical protein